MLIVAIDVGIKNFAYCAMRTTPGQPAEVLEWANETLVTGTYQPMKNVEYVRAFVAKHKALLDSADRIIVERQMRANMRIIESVFQAIYFDTCRIVQARTVKACYGLCMRNYRANKSAAVEFVHELLVKEGSPWLVHFDAVRKKDDLADAYLMALFFSTRGIVEPRASGEVECPSPKSPARSEAASSTAAQRGTSTPTLGPSRATSPTSRSSTRTSS
jgi:hypothetical protein